MPGEGRGGRGGGGRGLSREVQISKALSLVLRHSAEKENIKISREGYVNVADLLAWRRLKSIKATFEEILNAVEFSDKKRFSLLYIPPSAISSNGEGFGAETEGAGCKTIEREHGDATIALESTDVAVKTASSDENQQSATAHALSVKNRDPSRFLIRATQGHSMTSIDSETFLERLTLSDVNGQEGKNLETKVDLPDTVVHGTYHGAWPLILESGGLRAMGRTKVHFATGPSLDEVLQQIKLENNTSIQGQASKTVISGMRSDAQILIYIDLKKALAAGCPFYRSENGVILSEGIETEEGKQKVIPLEFFDVVIEKKERIGVLWENGEVVQELPANLANKISPKDRRGGGNRGRGRGGKRG